jgi:2-(1,2-epoxy-1,2-dihydrophenyl)acetyl-CoA isomerase
MGADTILYEAVGSIANITLNRPTSGNAFNSVMREQLAAAVQRAQSDDGIRIVLLTGAGSLFCAGADLNDPKRDPGLSLGQVIERQYKPLLMDIAHSPKLFIAVVNGGAAGIGASLVMTCDLAIMAEHAYLYMAFAKVGLVPDGGATWHLVRTLGHKRALSTIVEGAKLKADACVELGLANKVAPSSSLRQEAQQWAEVLAGQAPLALKEAKRLLRKVACTSLSEAISLEAQCQDYLATTADHAEGRKAFLEKGSSGFGVGDFDGVDGLEAL